MMNKLGKENIPCTYCDKPAIPGTEPPVCEEHRDMVKKASDSPETLKELENDTVQ